MSDAQIGGLVLLWLLAGWLGSSARSFFRLVLLAVVLVVVLAGCTRGGYCYHEAHRTGRAYARAVDSNRHRRHRQARVVERRLSREAEADRRLRDHSQLRRADVPTSR